MKRTILLCFSLFLLTLTACGTVDLSAPAPVFETGIPSDAWAVVPAGEFFFGQEAHASEIDYDYEMMVTDVTVTQYANFLNEALASGDVHIADFRGQQAVVGYYDGDKFHGAKHEEEITAGDWIYIPLTDPALKLTYNNGTFSPNATWEDHPMTMVSWFGAKGYCDYYGWQLPTEKEWEKAARGIDARPYPWGQEITRNAANYYASRDPFEDMKNEGSLTTPVGFYNGETYGDYTTADHASPYGLYDMAGNVWQWTADVYEGMHYRFMRGGSKDTYDMDLRVWVNNNATPVYTSPGVGFRCARTP